MFIIRSAIFRLHESPRFLVANRRSDECARVLSKIALINRITDFQPTMAWEGSSLKGISVKPGTGIANNPSKGELRPPLHSRTTSNARLEPLDHADYGHSNDSGLTLFGRKGRSSFHTPSEELGPPEIIPNDMTTLRQSTDSVNGETACLTEDSQEDQDDSSPHADISLNSRRKEKNGIRGWSARFSSLFQVQWWRTTILMIYIWTSMALGYGL
jgi:hypothetical protein